MNVSNDKASHQMPDSPDTVQRLIRQGTQALHQGNLSRAVELLEHAHRLDAKNGDAALNLGGAYILTKKFSQAVAILDPLAQREPDNPMVWTNLGAAYLGNPILARDEEQQRAIAAFERAFDLDPDTPNVAYNLGLIYRDRQEDDQALYWFRLALSANPDDADAQRNVARLEGKSNGGP